MRQIRRKLVVAGGAYSHEARGSGPGRSFLGERCSDLLPGRLLLLLRYAILDIQHQCIDLAQAQSLIDHLLPVARHKHPRAAQFIGHIGSVGSSFLVYCPDRALTVAV